MIKRFRIREGIQPFEHMEEFRNALSAPARRKVFSEHLAPGYAHQYDALSLYQALRTPTKISTVIDYVLFTLLPDVDPFEGNMPEEYKSVLYFGRDPLTKDHLVLLDATVEHGDLPHVEEYEFTRPDGIIDEERQRAWSRVERSDALASMWRIYLVRPDSYTSREFVFSLCQQAAADPRVLAPYLPTRLTRAKVLAQHMLAERFLIADGNLPQTGDEISRISTRWAKMEEQQEASLGMQVSTSHLVDMILPLLNDVPLTAELAPKDLNTKLSEHRRALEEAATKAMESNA